MSTVNAKDYLASEEFGIVDSDTGVLTNWRGPWVAGSYRKGDMVTDGVWLAIANTTTSEQPAGTSEDWDQWTIDELALTEDVVIDTRLFQIVNGLIVSVTPVVSNYDWLLSHGYIITDEFDVPMTDELGAYLHTYEG